MKIIYVHIISVICVLLLPSRRIVNLMTLGIVDPTIFILIR